MAVIHALERCTPSEREAIETVLTERAFDGVTHREIIAILVNALWLPRSRQRPCNAEYADPGKERHLQFPRRRNQARAIVGAGVCGGSRKVVGDGHLRLAVIFLQEFRVSTDFGQCASARDEPPLSPFNRNSHHPEPSAFQQRP